MIDSKKDPNRRLTKEEKKQLKKEAMDQMFGTNRGAYMGNIWGWNFSFISLIGLLLVFGFTAIGVWMGKIDLQKQHFEHQPSKYLKAQNPNLNKDTTNNTAK